MFQILDLFPSSGEAGETPTLLGPLERTSSFLVSWGGVRLGTSATIWPIVPVADDR
jgi:hypothetical protein